MAGGGRRDAGSGLIRVKASGDVIGLGVWRLVESDGAVELSYLWRVRVGKPWMQKFEFMLKPIFVANHNWVMRRGELQASRRAVPAGRSSAVLNLAHQHRRVYLRANASEETAMAYWLYKSEPDVFSWDDLVKAGKTGTEWTGVRNYTARNHMREMKKGDRGFYYHTGDEKAVVGIVEVVKEAHPDSTDDSGQWDCVDIRAVEKLKEPVTLAAVKAEKKLAEMALVRFSRFSVQPVTEAEWKAVNKMGGL